MPRSPDLFAIMGKRVTQTDTGFRFVHPCQSLNLKIRQLKGVPFWHADWLNNREILGQMLTRSPRSSVTC